MNESTNDEDVPELANDKDESKKNPKGKRKAKAAKAAKAAKGDVRSDTSYPGGDRWKWEGTTLLYWNNAESKASEKIAAFDFDLCLAKTSLFKKGPDQWSLLFPAIPTIFKKLDSEGYKIVIFTNQSDIGKAAKPETRKKAIDEKIGRLGGFVKQMGLPISVFIAAVMAPKTESGADYDPYRKPATGMWDFLVKTCNGDIKPDMKTSFFVGDAAGRKKDHGSSDKDFAMAVPITYYTETDFFIDGKGPGK